MKSIFKKGSLLILLSVFILFFSGCPPYPPERDDYKDRILLQDKVVDLSTKIEDQDFELEQDPNKDDEVYVTINQDVITDLEKDEIIILPKTLEYPNGIALKLLEAPKKVTNSRGVVSEVKAKVVNVFWDLVDELGKKDLAVNDRHVNISLLIVDGNYFNLKNSDEYSEVPQDIINVLKEYFPLIGDSSATSYLGTEHLEASLDFSTIFNDSEKPNEKFSASFSGRSIIYISGCFSLNNCKISLDVSSEMKRMKYQLKGNQKLALDIISSITVAGSISKKLKPIYIPIDTVAGGIALSLKISPIIDLSGQLELDSTFQISQETDINIEGLYEKGAYQPNLKNKFNTTADFNCLDFEIAANGTLGVGAEMYLCLLSAIGPQVTVKPTSTVSYGKFDIIGTDHQEYQTAIGFGVDLSTGINVGINSNLITVGYTSPNWNFYPAQKAPTNLRAEYTSSGVVLSWENNNSLTKKYLIYRRVAGDFEKIGEVPIATTTTYTDNNIASDVDYKYAVKAVAPFWSTWYSNEATINTNENSQKPDTEFVSKPQISSTISDVNFSWTGTDNKTSTNDLKYSYWLKEVDSNWSSFTSLTSKSYFSLPPGHYTFQVKAQDKDGFIDDSPATYSFIISSGNRLESISLSPSSKTLTQSHNSWSLTGVDVTAHFADSPDVKYANGYTWTKISGPGSFNSSTQKYTVGGAGTAIIRCSLTVDGITKTADYVIKVGKTLTSISLSPSSKTLTQSHNSWSLTGVDVTAHFADSPDVKYANGYTWTKISGPGSFNSSTQKYTVGGAGTAIIRCSLTVDGITKTADYVIKVGKTLTSISLSPSSKTLTQSHNSWSLTGVDVTAHFADSPDVKYANGYTWTKISGPGSFNSSTQKYTVGGAGTAIIRCSLTVDGITKTADYVIKVGKTLTSISLSPSSKTLTQSHNSWSLTGVDVTAHFADSPDVKYANGYTWTKISGPGSFNSSTQKYTVGGAGTAIIRCSLTVDGITKTADYTITVEGGTKTKVLYSVADAYIYNPMWDNNTGNYNFLITGGVGATDGTGVMYSLIKFKVADNIPSGTTVLDADLRLYIHYYENGSVPVRIAWINDYWGESSVLWDNRPSATYYTANKFTLPASAGYVKLDITDEIQRMVDNQLNYGIMIFPVSKISDHSVGFLSRDYGSSSYSPKLTIEYEL